VDLQNQLDEIGAEVSRLVISGGELWADDYGTLHITVHAVDMEHILMRDERLQPERPMLCIHAYGNTCGGNPPHISKIIYIPGIDPLYAELS
jgi:hypothetical protein